MFKKLKLSAKIAALAAVLFIFMAIVGIVGVINMFSAKASSAYTAHEVLPAVKSAGDILDSKGNFRAAIRTFTYTSDPASAKEAREWLDTLAEEIKKAQELTKTAKGLKFFPLSIAKIEPEVKILTQLCDSIFDFGLKQNKEKEMFSVIGDKVTEDAIKIRDEMSTQRDEGLNSSSTKDRDDLLKFSFDLMRTRIKLNRFLQSIDTSGAAEITIARKADAALLDEIINSNTVSNEFRTRLNEVKKDFDEYFDDFEEYVVLQQHRNETYKKQLSMIGTFSEDVTEMMDTLVYRSSGLAMQTVGQMDTNSIIMVVLLILAIIFGIIMSVFIINSIVKPITKAIDELSSGSNQITGASGEISNASQAMASGASQQASSLEEISASLNQITSMTKQTADNAKSAEDLVKDSVDKSKASKEAMDCLLEAVRDIKQSGDDTAKILKDIDEIAFQTNLLALNAAVEAARAGEAGKGFAVVAEEVRNLAQRSAAAAKKTADLINNSQKSSENGVNLAEETAQSIEKIAEASMKIEIIVDEIAKAAYEQANGVSQVNIAIGSLDQVTQSNASQSEELAASSEELSSQALSINDLVGDLVSVVAGEMARMERERNAMITKNPNTGYGGMAKTPLAGRYGFIPRKISTAAQKSGNVIQFNDDKVFNDY